MIVTHKDIIIIGAGQSGLSMANYLEHNNNDYLVLEKNEVASSWKNHYDSLKLITPNPFISLQGKKFISKNKFPTKHEVVEYLEEYSKEFTHNIRTNQEVLNVLKNNDQFIIETNQEFFSCNKLIIASGYNGVKFTPKVSEQLQSSIIQLHSSEYKSLDSLPKESLNIAVVGSGNSGISIAKELSSVHNVHLFQGNVKRMPRQVMGIDIFWWANTFGLFKIKTGTKLGDKMSKKLIPKGDPTYGLYPEKIAKTYNFKLYNRVKSCRDKVLVDANNNEIQVDAVIWATGYKTNYHTFLPFPIFDKNNQVIHKRGVTSEKNLYFLGLKWQSNISSFLIFGVKEDAKHLFKHICKN